MTTYSTPYKTGTVSSISGNTLTVAGFTPDANDVDRLVVINSGAAKFQHRRVTAVSGQDLTIAHPMNTNPYLDPTTDKRATDILPTAGDTVVMAYKASELIATDSDMTLVNAPSDLVVSSLTARSGAYIHFENYNIEIQASQTQSGRDGGLIFGYYEYSANEDGYEVNPCTITETSGTLGFTNFRAGNNDFGLFDMYGGIFRSQGPDLFVRLYEDTANPANCQVRIINAQFFGNFGSRVDGNRSMIIARSVSNQSVNGPFNPRTAVARTQVTSLNSFQSGYVFLLQGASGRITITKAKDISSRVLRVLASPAAGAGQVYEVIAKKPEIDAIPIFAFVDGDVPTHTIRYGNLVKPTFINPDLSPVTESLSVILLDVNGTTVDTQTLLTGVFPELFVRHTDIPSSSGNKTLSSGTLFAPYSLRAVNYDSQISVSSITAEDTYDPNIVIFSDDDIQEPDKNVVDAYTEINTSARLHDRAKADLFDNFAGETTKFVTLNGDEANLGSFDLTIDATASQAYLRSGTTLITIKASTYTGDITTSGTVTEVNGATVAGTVTDVNGTRFPARFLTMPNVDDGVRVTADHVQFFTVDTATDVDTVNDTITLGNDINGDAPAFASAVPYTLVRLTAASGGTLPNSSTNQIRNWDAENGGGAYYATISGSDITLYPGLPGVTTAIDLNSAGTGTFTLRAETSLFNVLASGGSGISQELSLSSGAQIRVRACQWSNTSGTATSSTFFDNRDNLISWSTDSGASSSVAVGLTSGTLETVHEEIIDAITANSRKFGQLATTNDGSGLDATNGGPFSISLEGLGRVQVNTNDPDGKELIQNAFAWYCWVRFQDYAISVIDGDTFTATGFFDYSGKNFAIDNRNTTTPFLLAGGTLSIAGVGTGVAEGSESVYLNTDTSGTGALLESSASSTTADLVADTVLSEAVADHSGTAGSLAAIIDTISTLTTRVDGLIEDSSGDRFTTKALETAPIADVSGIPTNPLLTDDARLNNLDVAVSTRSSHAAPDLSGLSTFDATSDSVTIGTNNDKTGYSLTQAFPTNFDSLSIDGSGQVTAGNMRGTDGANTVAPDNASIADILADTGTDIPNAIAAIPTNPLLTNDARLNNLDATISSRSSHPAPDLSALATSAEVGAIPTNPLLTTDSRLNNLDAPVSNAGGLDASATRAAIGLASANLDAQLGNIPTVAEFEARTIPSANYFDPINDVVARVALVDTTTTNTDMRGTDSALTSLPVTIPTGWLTDIQDGLAIESKQDTIIANIGALGTLANQTAMLSTVADISDLMGFTSGQAMVSDTSDGTITANGKTITVTTNGTQRTYTRS